MGLNKAGMLAIDILLVFLSLGLAALVYFVPYWKQKKTISLKQYFTDNYSLLAASVIFFIGFAFRLCFLDQLPGGLNQDEASAGYDAFAIMRWGEDRNGNAYPVHLVAWGSGQNALYSYLMIPFIAILGLNEISVRLPMAAYGCLSLYFLYKYLSRYHGKETSLVGLFFLAICPWHIMKSRWGLESNLFPDLVLDGFLLLMIGIKEKKIWIFLVSAFVLGLSSYSYGTSYFFLFFFIIFGLIYLLCQKRIRWTWALYYLGIVGFVCIPIMIFIWINVKGGDSVHLLWFTIPKLTANRFSAVTNLFSGSFASSAWDNFSAAMKVLFSQDDGLCFNSIKWIGTTYLISIPFFFYGLFHRADEAHRDFFWLLRIWFFVCLLMLFIVSPNINRINIIFFPIIIFSFIGLEDFILLLTRYRKAVIPALTAVYLALFCAFSVLYFTSQAQQIRDSFFYSLGDAIKYVDSIDEEASKVYITSNINMPYIDVLFYTRYDVKDFISTVQYSNPDGSFRYVSSFGKYYFYLPSSLTKGNIYLVENSNPFLTEHDLSAYQVTAFASYTVVDAR